MPMENLFMKTRVNKNLMGLFTSVFLIFSYNNIFMTITPVYLMKLGGNQFLVGLQSAIFLISAIGLRFFFGPLADVKGPKLTMFIGAGTFLAAGILFIFSSHVWEVFFLRFIQAIGLAAYFPGATTTVMNGAPEGMVGRYVGIYRLVTTSTLLFGPVFALGLIAAQGYEVYYLIMAVVALIGLLLILPIHNRIQPFNNNRKYRHSLTIENFKGTFVIYFTTFVFAIGYGLLFNFTILFVTAHTNISNPGQFYTLFAIGGIIASLTLGMMSDKIGRLRAMTFALFFLGIGIGGFYFIPGASSLFYLSGLFTGFGYSGGIVISVAWIGDSVSQRIRSTALSFHQNCIDLGIAFGSSTFGIVLGKFNYSPMIFACMGIGLIAYMPILLHSNRKIDRIRSNGGDFSGSNGEMDRESRL